MMHKGHVLAPTSTGTGAWIRLQGCAPGGRMLRDVFVSSAVSHFCSCMLYNIIDLLCRRYHVVSCRILRQSEARRIFESRQQRLRGLPKVEAPTWENFHCGVTGCFVCQNLTVLILCYSYLQYCFHRVSFSACIILLSQRYNLQLLPPWNTLQVWVTGPSLNLQVKSSKTSVVAKPKHPQKQLLEPDWWSVIFCNISRRN